MKTKTIMALILLGMCFFIFIAKYLESNTSCDKEKTANFIVECARAANPMSDEEGEALVRECGSQAHFIFCEFKK